MAEGIQSRTQNSLMKRWGLGRAPLRWSAGSSPAGRKFEEDLALFERQVEEEGRRRGERS